jgi:transaldolase
MSRLEELCKFGQSPWYDNIERSLLFSGGLKKLIDDGITGVTSNPSIFEKAINGSDAYNADIEQLARQGKDTDAIYDELTTSDVSMAADVLGGVFESSGRLDGFVSIEVSPHLAHEEEGTIAEAKRIFKKINKANIMIKIPATPAGFQAIQRVIAEGINVNATLIFSQAHYLAAADAYLSGLWDRVKKDLPIDHIRSVASFFVSRIDTRVDKLLREKGNHSLLGKAAVAQTKVVNSLYRKLFYGENFEKLKAEGAQVQRLLFGSTSTKDPAYRDVKYVEEIIGEGTVNTLPHATVEAFKDHGVAQPTLDQGLEDAHQVLADLKTLGIDMEQVCQRIQDEGVQAFVDAYDRLINALENKRKKLVS